MYVYVYVYIYVYTYKDLQEYTTSMAEHQLKLGQHSELESKIQVAMFVSMVCRHHVGLGVRVVRRQCWQSSSPGSKG